MKSIIDVINIKKSITINQSKLWNIDRISRYISKGRFYSLS